MNMGGAGLGVGVGGLQAQLSCADMFSPRTVCLTRHHGTRLGHTYLLGKHSMLAVASNASPPDSPAAPPPPSSPKQTGGNEHHLLTKQARAPLTYKSCRIHKDQAT
jgi:hypothetical protein